MELLPLASGARPVMAQPQPDLPPSPGSVPAQAHVSATLGSTPAMFIENAGQFGDSARFQVSGNNGTIWLAEDAIWVTVLEEPSFSQTPSTTSGEWEELFSSPSGREVMGESNPRNSVNIKLSFPGANPRPRLEPFNRLDTHISYFIGDDPAWWHADTPVWGGVRYKDLYPGIDLEITGENGHIMPRLVALEGAILDVVRLRVEGADEIALESDLLRLTTAVGEYTMPLLQVSGAGSVKLLPPTIVGGEVTSPFGNPQPEVAKP